MGTRCHLVYAPVFVGSWPLGREARAVYRLRSTRNIKEIRCSEPVSYTAPCPSRCSLGNGTLDCLASFIECVVSIMRMNRWVQESGRPDSCCVQANVRSRHDSPSGRQSSENPHERRDCDEICLPAWRLRPVRRSRRRRRRPSWPDRRRRAHCALEQHRDTGVRKPSSDDCPRERPGDICLRN